LENFEGAVGYFQRLLRETPDGNKVPDAMLKMSLAYERQGRVDSAKETLEKLVNQYPTTQAGQLGAQKLGQ
jgi:TolA-binding protein